MFFTVNTCVLKIILNIYALYWLQMKKVPIYFMTNASVHVSLQ